MSIDWRGIVTRGIWTDDLVAAHDGHETELASRGYLSALVEVAEEAVTVIYRLGLRVAGATRRGMAAAGKTLQGMRAAGQTRRGMPL